MQKDKLSSQLCAELSPGYITSWITNQASENLKKIKLYQASFLTTKLWDQKEMTGEKEGEKHKHTEAKWYITKYIDDHRRNF